MKRDLIHLACCRSSQSSHLSHFEEVKERLEIIDYLVTNCQVDLQEQEEGGRDEKEEKKQVKSYRDISPLFTCYNHSFYLLAHYLILNYSINLNTTNTVTFSFFIYFSLSFFHFLFLSL